MGEFNKDTDCMICKRTIDYDKVRVQRIIAGEDRFEKYCSDCVHTKAGVKDVWYGYGSGEHTEENICDPSTGQPIPFSSRRGKWEAMQRAGVVEVGDKVHGSRSTYTGK